MAVPKEVVSERFGSFLQPFLEPGERSVAAAFVIPGPSPMAIGFIGALIQLAKGQGDMWMTVSDRRVLFVRATFMTQKPKALAWADSRHTVQIAEVHAHERSGWNWFVYARPGEDPLRINLSVVWEEEFAAIVDVLSSPPAPPLGDWPDG